ncbi:MAG: hypothetical protein QX189_12795 [Methylococcales bacterium]
MSATLVHQGKVFESKILTGVQSAIKESRVYDVALFLASPFIGLAYAVALPFVGTGMILYQGWKALKSSNT